MTATLPAEPRSNARNLYGEKETIGTLLLFGVRNGAPDHLATARFYMARSGDGASPVYCSVWLHSGNWTSGRGRATGGGYHKKSAALDAALTSAGITLSERIDGCGDSAMLESFRAIGEAMGHDRASLLAMEA